MYHCKENTSSQTKTIVLAKGSSCWMFGFSDQWVVAKLKTPPSKQVQLISKIDEERNMKKTQKKSALTQTTEEYAGRSSIHGIGYIFDRELNIVDRLLWLFVVFAFLGIASAISWNFWSQWRNEQVWKKPPNAIAHLTVTISAIILTQICHEANQTGPHIWFDRFVFRVERYKYVAQEADYPYLFNELTVSGKLGSSNVNNMFCALEY